MKYEVQMMRVAVCDCNEFVRKQIKDFSEHVSGVDGCDEYATLPALLAAAERGRRYQVIIMAIEWDGKADGFEGAGKIQSLDLDSRIIYMTEYPMRYMQQIFLRPAMVSGFLIKPVNEDVLAEYIRKILDEKEAERKGCLLVKYKKGILSVQFDEMLYLESESHLITIQTKTERYHYYGRLVKILKTLPENFIQCHQSYIVNMQEIRRIERFGFQMKNGVRVPISKSRYRETKVQYAHYIEKFMKMEETV